MEEQNQPRAPTAEEQEILRAVLGMLKEINAAKKKELQEGFEKVARQHGITIKDLNRMFMEVGFGHGRVSIVESLVDITCAQRVIELLQVAWPKKGPKGAGF